MGGGSSTACLRPKNPIFDQKTVILAVFSHEKTANFGAYGCFKWSFGDTYASTTCVPACSTLEIEDGSSTAYLKPKKSILNPKKAFFGRFFMKNGKFWCIRML